MWSGIFPAWAGVELGPVRDAMADGLHAVAAVKAERLLAGLVEGDAERGEVAGVAVEAWVRAAEPEKALKILDAEKVPGSDFWHAQALVLKEEPDEAEVFLRRALERDEGGDRARLLLAKVQLMRGIEVEARHLLEGLLASREPDVAREAALMTEELALMQGGADGVLDRLGRTGVEGDGMKAYLRARALLSTGRTAEARNALRVLASDRGAGVRLHQAAALLLAESLLKENKLAEAQETVVALLNGATESEFWMEAFELLRRTGPTQPGEPIPAVPVGWIAPGGAVPAEAGSAAASSVVFRGHAMHVVAQWLEACERPQAAVGLLEALLEVAPGHPVENDAIRRVMELHLSMGADDRVLALAERWRSSYDVAGASSVVDFVSGSIFFVRGDYTEAMERFQSAASVAGSLGERRRAIFNAAVAAYRAGQVGLYRALLSQLEVAAAGGPEGKARVAAGSDSGETAVDLELDRALDLAARRNPEAEAILRQLTKDAQGHPRLAEGWIALAEMALQKSPPDLEEARRAMGELGGGAQLPAEVRQRKAYVEMWLAATAGDLPGTVGLGQAFLEAWPDSVLVPEVRMKVAELYYRQADFANARTEFEKVAREHPESGFADTALYYAGMSAAAVMTEEGVEQAIGLWDELAGRGGGLGFAARRQQAMAKRRQGHEGEALAVLDKLLQETELDEDLRRLVTCEKAEILIVLGKSGVEMAEGPTPILEEMLAGESLPCLWRLRAGFTLAAAHREAGETALALEACYDAVKSAETQPPKTPGEFDWFFKAGFFAVEMLEEAAQWEAAARMAEVLASSGGPRAGEAEKRAAKIRLAHFIWEEGKAPPPETE